VAKVRKEFGMALWNLLLIFPAFAPANDSLSTDEVSRYLKTLEQVSDEARPNRPKCPIPTDGEALPNCAVLTDQLCETLWNGTNRGSLEVFDGRILRAESPKSGYSQFYFEDLRALIESRPHLPTDIAESIGPLLETLRIAISEEDATKAWKRRIADIKRNIDRALLDVQEARIEKIRPGFTKKDERDYSIEEKVLVRSIDHLIRDELLEAKYKDHPNWKRVERVFHEAQNDLAAGVAAMDIPEADKQLMLERIGSIKLTLPYMSKEKGGAEEDCGTTRISAYYLSFDHIFTVCAGFFNSFQSDSILYGTITHEIAHAIDPVSIARYRREKESAVIKALRPLDGSKTPPYDCNEWRALVSGPLEPKKDWAPKAEFLPDLLQCLAPRDGLKRLTAEAAKSVAETLAHDLIIDFANESYFFSLLIPSHTKFGEVKVNETYLRPDLQFAENVSAYRRKDLYTDVNPVEVFAQSLACQGKDDQSQSADFSSLPIEERTRRFLAAIRETERILSTDNEDWFAYCGQSCRELVRFRLANPTQENFADWASFKALPHRLARIETRKERQDAAALFSADLCSYPSVYAADPELAELERQFSTKGHSDNRYRRVSVFTPEVASIIACKVDPDGAHKGYSQCEP
jgi:hypothetical protein